MIIVSRLRGAVAALVERWVSLMNRLGIGHRAAFLIGFGAIYVVLGLGVVLSPAPPDPYLFHTQLPFPIRVGLWASCGLAAIVGARSDRWQWTGFAALTPPPIERAISYLIAVVETFPPGPPIPWPYLNALALYGGVLFVVSLVSTWPDPPTDPQPVQGVTHAVR